MRDLTYDLAGNVAKVKYDDLPEDAVGITKKFILDTLATTLAGSSAPGCKSVVDQVKDWGGKEESTILVYGGKAISENAALANSMMAHALDLDDTHDEAVIHSYVSVLPAALAMAERNGGVGGKDLITAVTLGVDLMCRLGLASFGHDWVYSSTMAVTLGVDLMCRLGLASFGHDWVYSSTMAYFGATVAAGKIIGLTKDELQHAMGIAYSQCAGNLQCIKDGGLVKRMQPAFAARAAILSSILAQTGITGATEVFEGQFGFFPSYHRGKYAREAAVKELGKVFEGVNSSIKLYPCCRYTHGSIDATLSIVQENDIKPDNVVEVVAHVTQDAYNLVGKPFEIRESPQVDAQFSIPYTVSVAIARKNVFIDDFFEEKIKGDTQVLQLTKKVKVVVDQEPIAKGLTPCVVDVKTKDGKVYSEHVEILRGDPRKPVSMEEVAQKFRRCAAFSAKPIPKENIEEIIRTVSNLESVADVSSIVSLVV